MFSLKTRPLIILYIRLKHPIYASKSGQLGYYTSCGNNKFELLQIRKHFYSFCIRRGAWRGGGVEGLALKRFRERKKMLRDHPVWSEQDKHVAENIPSTQKRKRQTVKHNWAKFGWNLFQLKSRICLSFYGMLTVQNELALYLETGVQCTLYLAYVDPRCLNATMWFQLKT